MTRVCFLSRLMLLVAAVVLPTTSLAGEPFYSVRDYGARGDGTHDDTLFIQSAIDHVSEKGGGTLVFPAGTYLSGTLRLRSYLTLRFESGATLLGSVDLEKYPVIRPNFRAYTDNYVLQSLLYGEDLEQIALVGEGTIDGQGGDSAFRRGTGVELGLLYGMRPYVLRLVRCKNIRVSGITLRDSPMWMQHYLACDDLVIRGITVESNVNHNNDGINIDCCRNVRISDCYIHSGDDAIVLKSTADRTCENVAVTNCVVSTICNGIKLGTESNSGFRNIAISNCTVRKPGEEEDDKRQRRGLAGIGLMIVDGGVLERVVISNIAIHGMQSAFFIRLGDRARPFEADGPIPSVGSVRDIQISNVVARDIGPVGSSITGLPDHCVENVLLSDIDVRIEGGGAALPPGAEVPEAPKSYPEHNMFGSLPSHGLYCRHVRGLNLRNVRFGWENSDDRPGLVCEDVADLRIEALSIQPPSGEQSAVILHDVHSAWIAGFTGGKPDSRYLHASGDSKDIVLMGNDFNRVRNPVTLGEGVPAEAVHQEPN